MHSILNSISYHTVYDPSINEAIAYARKNGFAGIQIADESPHLSYERLSTREVENIKCAAKEQGIYIVLHAVDAAASLFQPNQHLIDGIRDYYTTLLEFAHKVSAKLVTIHAGEITGFPTDSQPEYYIPHEDLVFYQEVFQENLVYLLDTNNKQVPICIEYYNLDETTMDTLIPYLARGDIFLCWDIAKCYGQPELEDFFLRHLPWVKQVHLHDRRQNLEGRVRTHCVIGTGDIDFTPYLTVLSKGNIEDFCIEVRPREKAKESLEALRTMIKQLDKTLP